MNYEGDEPGVVTIEVGDLKLAGPLLYWGDKLFVLSPVLMDIMALFMRHPNTPLSARYIRDVCTTMVGYGEELVRSNILFLRRTLEEPKGNPRLIRTLQMHGYILVTDVKLGELLDRKYTGLGKRLK